MLTVLLIALCWPSDALAGGGSMPVPESWWDLVLGLCAIGGTGGGVALIRRLGVRTIRGSDDPTEQRLAEAEGKVAALLAEREQERAEAIARQHQREMDDLRGRVAALEAREEALISSVDASVTEARGLLSQVRATLEDR